MDILLLLAGVAIVAPLLSLACLRNAPRAMWLYPVAAAAMLPLSFPLVCLAEIAGGWVGGGGPIPFWSNIVFLPALAIAVGGLAILIVGCRRRSASLIVTGVVGILSGFCQFSLIAIWIGVGIII